VKNAIKVVYHFQLSIHEAKYDTHLDHLGVMMSVEFLHCEITVFILERYKHIGRNILLFLLKPWLTNFRVHQQSLLQQLLMWCSIGDSVFPYFCYIYDLEFSYGDKYFFSPIYLFFYFYRNGIMDF
jgi:hypothetical protein